MSLDEVLASIVSTGEATGTADAARLIVADLRRRLDHVAAAVRGASTRSVLVLEWTDPAFTAGHWVPDMVEAAGGRCVLGRPGPTRRVSSGRRSVKPGPTW